MTKLRARLANLTVRATSPDANIRAETKGGEVCRLEFRPGSYEKYKVDDLEHQIARLATLLFTGHERGVREIKEEAGIRRRNLETTVLDRRDRDYIERVTSITVEAAGGRDMVWLATTGMLDWDCEITEKALDLLSEDEFVSEALGAARLILSRTSFEAALLKDEYYGLDLPVLTEERRRRANQTNA